MTDLEELTEKEKAIAQADEARLYLLLAEIEVANLEYGMGTELNKKVSEFLRTLNVSRKYLPIEKIDSIKNDYINNYASKFRVKTK